MIAQEGKTCTNAYDIYYCYCHHSNASSIVATDTGSGYRQPRARLGHNRVRSWKLVSFTNPARKVCFYTYNTVMRLEPTGDLLLCTVIIPSRMEQNFFIGGGKQMSPRSMLIVVSIR